MFGARVSYATRPIVFTITKPQNLSIYGSVLNKVCLSPDFKAVKL